MSIRRTFPFSSERRPPALSWRVAAALFCVAVGCEDAEAPPGPPPLAGSRPELERWVVYLKIPPPDPAPYREALEKDPAEALKVAERLRQEAARSRQAFVQRLGSLGGRVVDHWWLTGAVTVELPGGNEPTLRLLDDVERVEPDQRLSP